MTARAFLLALAVVAVWGTNFVVIKLALGELPPLLFAALRFAAVVCPAALFLKRPDVALRDLAAYGLLIGVGQFGLLFIAIDGLIAPGLASLLMQAQVFFTIALVMRSTGERLLRIQWLALALAGAGLGIIVAHTGGQASSTGPTLAGVALCLVAALSWAFANVIQRRAGQENGKHIDMLAFVVWSSLFAVPPLIVLALIFEGPSVVVAATLAAGWGAWLAVLWQAVGNAMFGFGAWGWLLARYPASSVAPMALLVPVFGMAASAWFLGEPLEPWKLGAGALILGGLAVNLLGPRLLRRALPLA